MKSWLRARRGSPDSREAKPQVGNTSISSPSRHVWSQNDYRFNSLTGSDNNASSSVTTLTQNSETELTTAPLRSEPPEVQLLNRFSSQVSTDSDKGLARTNVLITSEHYFRIALEAYEQLKAAHYRASQEFSLAEWLHIHALLLYGRIQSVRKAIEVEPVSPHNQVDLSEDVAVFAPIATALNAIGSVEDRETGVLYIPDAVFPSDTSSDGAFIGEQNLGYSTRELQQILAGVLYDWQRSWRRVHEAREKRLSRNTKFRMLRSSSELISAIREATDSIAKIRNEQSLSPAIEQLSEHSEKSETETTPKKDLNLELVGREKHLMQLFEEARNAKDYTLRPPCDRVYNREASILVMKSHPFRQRTHESSANSSTIVSTKLQTSLFHDGGPQGELGSRDAVQSPAERSAAAEDWTPSRNIGGQSMEPLTAPHEDQPPPLDDSSVSLDVEKQLDAVSLAMKGNSLEECTPDVQPEEGSFEEHLTLDPRKQKEGHDAPVRYGEAPNSSSRDLRSSESDTSEVRAEESTQEFESKKRVEDAGGTAKNSELRRQPQFLVPTIRTVRKTEMNASPPPRSAMRRPQTLYEGNRESPFSSPESKSCTSPELSPESALTASSQGSHTKSRVKIGGSSDHLDCFVNYDSQLWQDYAKFVEALREKKVAKFGSLKRSPQGTYAWMLPVKVNHASYDRIPRLLLPRKSIPIEDQMLALILQTSHASPKLLESWHCGAIAHVDLKQLLTEYVKTSVVNI